MTIIKKYEEMNPFEIISIINGILSDDRSISDMWAREIYRQLYLIKFCSDYDLSEFEDENGALDIDEAGQYLENNPSVFKVFEKGFGKKNLDKFQLKLDKHADEKLYEVNVALKVDIEKQLSKLEEIMTTAMDSLQGFMGNEKHQKLIEKLMQKGAQDDVQDVNRKMTKDELLKKRAKDTNGKS